MESVFPEGLDLDDALNLLRHGSVYVFGMTIYALFVFGFYRFLSARDMFALDLSKYEQSRFRLVRAFLHFVLYVAKYMVLFPVFAFFWFAALTVMLAFLSREGALPGILLMALAMVGTIRVTSYLSSGLSTDLAKILPFSVLAIFVIDQSFFTVRESLEVLREVRDYSATIVYYLAFLIVLEFALRLLTGLWRLLLAGDRKQTPMALKPVEETLSAAVDGSPTEEPTAR